MASQLTGAARRQIAHPVFGGGFGNAFKIPTITNEPNVRFSESTNARSY